MLADTLAVETKYRWALRMAPGSPLVKGFMVYCAHYGTHPLAYVFGQAAEQVRSYIVDYAHGR